jgi:hypothetical protein
MDSWRGLPINLTIQFVTLGIVASTWVYDNRRSCGLPQLHNVTC